MWPVRPALHAGGAFAFVGQRQEDFVDLPREGKSFPLGFVIVNERTDGAGDEGQFRIVEVPAVAVHQAQKLSLIGFHGFHSQRIGLTLKPQNRPDRAARSPPA